MIDRDDSLPMVLIVDDEALVRELAADILREAGFGVLEAGDANEAAEVLHRRNDIQGVLTDIEMPGMTNGLALASTIRQSWPWIGVVITSGRFAPEPARMPEGSLFIAKPWRAKDLVARIHKVVRLDECS